MADVEARKPSVDGGDRTASVADGGDRKPSADGGVRKASVTVADSPGRPSFASQGRKPSLAERRASMKPKVLDLDDVLVNELGQFGPFQLRNILLVSIPIIMSAFMSEYIFSAAVVPHRCAIPECDDATNPLYDPEWILNAVPATTGGFANCQRYAPAAGANASSTFCPANAFNQANLLDCDGYVHGRTNSVVYDFGLECSEWLRALAGTLNSVGTLLVLPITGYVSDRFGRRVALVISVFNLALVGLIRAFSVNYPMYLALQLLQTTLGAGTYSSCYIIATELVGPKYRVVTGAVSSSMYAVGQVVLGSVAWLIQPWRYMIMALHIPCFLIITYYWFLSESVRWLLAKHKYERAREVLENVARVNKTEISEKSMTALTTPPEPELKVQDEKPPGLFKTIFKSSVLLRRVCTTPVWWISATFVYYGLTINSVGLSGNMYLNFILVSAIEIPGYFTAVLLLDRIGRKATLSGAFFLSAACNIAFAFVDPELATFRLILFLVGKFGISGVMMSNYLFTSELYPTEYRHSLLAFSSMIGRIGSITAPLTPALMDYWAGIPSLMFGFMGCLSGLLVLTQPETLGTSLPNTLAEAERLGEPDSYRRR